MSVPFLVGGVQGEKGSIIGDTSLIVIGLNSTLMSLIATPMAIREGIKNGFERLIPLLVDAVQQQMIPDVQLYWTGDLRSTVKGSIYGKAGKLGGNITAVIRAGSNKVWYAYKVHELGRGWGSHSWSKKRLWGYPKKKAYEVKATGDYTYPPIPYMRIAYAAVKKDILGIMTEEINKSLTMLVFTQGMI